MKLSTDHDNFVKNHKMDTSFTGVCIPKFTKFYSFWVLYPHPCPDEKEI